MSNYEQQPQGPPPPVYPLPTQGYPPPAYTAPPPVGYPMKDGPGYPEQQAALPVETKSKGATGFCNACLKILCCAMDVFSTCNA